MAARGTIAGITKARQSSPDGRFSPRPSGERRERRRVARNRRAVHVEDERDEAVIARERHDIEHRRLAETPDRGREGGIADVAVIEKLHAEIVDETLVVRERGRPVAPSD